MSDGSSRLAILGSEAAEYKLEEYGELGPPVGVPLDGPMNHRGVAMWNSEDGSILTGLWECDAGRLRADFGPDGGEFIHLVSGHMTCLHDDGTLTELGPGDTMTFPPGWTGTWDCKTPMRKFYTVFKVGS